MRDQVNGASPEQASESEGQRDSPSRFGGSIARGIALFIAFFTLLNLVISLRHPGYDANLWWIDLFPLPQKAPLVAQSAWLFFAAVLLAYALWPTMVDWRRRATRMSIEVLSLFVVWNIISYYGLLVKGRAHSPLPVPFAAFVLILLWAAWRGARGTRSSHGPGVWVSMALTVGALAVLVPVLQIMLFGLMDFRGTFGIGNHRAEAVIVMGGSSATLTAQSVEAAAEIYRNSTTITGTLVRRSAEGGLPVVEVVSLAPSTNVDSALFSKGPSGTLAFKIGVFAGAGKGLFYKIETPFEGVDGTHYSGTMTDGAGGKFPATLHRFFAKDGTPFALFAYEPGGADRLSHLVKFDAAGHFSLLSEAVPDGGVTELIKGERATNGGVAELKGTDELKGEEHTPVMILVGNETETRAMREQARKLGVSENAIVTDPHGVSFEACVQAANLRLIPLDTADRKTAAVVVGHFHELPRVRMAFWREERELLTAPVRTPASGSAAAVLRESAALWRYYFDAAMR
jgi:hypothetical protein